MNLKNHEDEADEPRIYTNLIDIIDDIDILCEKAPRDKRSREYKKFLKDYNHLAVTYNNMCGWKCLKTKI